MNVEGKELEAKFFLSKREEMEIIVSEVSRLERLVGEVLGYARLARPEFKLMDINGLVKSMMVTMQDEIDRNLIKAIYRLDPDLPHAHEPRDECD